MLLAAPAAAVALLMSGLAGGTPTASAQAAVSVASATDPCNNCIAWSWGNNLSGQLGDGTTTLAGTPTQVSGLTDVAQIVAGQGHTLALLRDGTVWAWGANDYGQLGNGTTTASLVPVQVPGLSNVVSVVAGYNDSFALQRDGTLWAWGANFHGQLGTGTFSTSPNTTPVQVHLTGVKAIAADDGYSGGSTVAIRNDGTVWAWGFYTVGSNVNVLPPTQVPGLEGITAVSTNSGHTLALSSDGTVWAWGTNDLDQLGDGTLNDAASPIKVNGLTGVTAVSTGHGDSLALRSDGSVMEWGWQFTSANGPSGGVVITSPTPIQATADGFPTIAAISEGELHSLAVGTDGSVWAWGDDFYRELGNGTNVDSWTPIQVNGLSGITAVSAGYDDSLAATTTPIPSPPPTPTTSLSPSPTPSQVQPGQYVALGDSYSSGEGTGNYLPGTDDPSLFDTCHRSPHAYGPLLDTERRLGSIVFAACSGAVTDDMYVANLSNPNEPPQFSRLSSSTKIVTLTIGGNDAELRPHNHEVCRRVAPWRSS